MISNHGIGASWFLPAHVLVLYQRRAVDQIFGRFSIRIACREVLSPYRGTSVLSRFFKGIQRPHVCLSLQYMPRLRCQASEFLKRSKNNWRRDCPEKLRGGRPEFRSILCTKGPSTVFQGIQLMHVRRPRLRCQARKASFVQK